MNSTPSRSANHRAITPLTWACGGTLLLHGAFLLLLWLWPPAPPKPRETLLQVDLTKNQAAPQPKPTAAPTPLPKVAQLKQPQPRRQPVPTPLPLPTQPPRLAKVTVVAPTPAPVKPLKTQPAPTAPPPPQPTDPPKTTPATSVRTRRTEKAAASSSPKPAETPQRTRTNHGGKGSPSKPPKPDTVAPTAPSGGSARRRFARNDEPEDAGRHTTAPATNRAGSNSLGHSAETAGADSGLELPRTRARRGRSGPLAPPSSAPTKSSDGTEVDIGPSRPSSAGSDRRRTASDASNGDLDSGDLRRSGLSNGSAANRGGAAPTGRGSDEMAGDGGSGGARGTGARGTNGRGTGGRGRRGSRLASDPFGNGGSGRGRGTGRGNGDGNGDGSINGPPSGTGTRLARRGFGDGDGDTPGRGTGRGNGVGDGSGLGGRGTGDQGTGTGRGGAENAEGTGSGRSRASRGRGARGQEVENQLGRGIWGGFRIRFYQDKAAHPDLPDATFHPGNPIDWPVFTKLAATKTVPNLNFDWAEKPPAPGMNHTFWSLKASGRIFVPKDDTYEFFFDELDDAGSLTLDGKQIIKIWQVQKSSPSSGKMFLKRGPHDMQIEYVQGPATAASIKLSWRSTSFPKEIVGVYQAPTDE